MSPFGNTTAITINDAPPDGVAKASLYPSVIHVSGISANAITKARVVLNEFSHTFPDDVDILLVAPDGTRSVVMSDAGGNVSLQNKTLTFSATGAVQVPDDTAISDAQPMRPANRAAGDASFITDVFPAPGPGTRVLEPGDFDAFNGIDPNGDWSLYVVDDSVGDVGSIAGGWTLLLTVPTIYTVNKTADTNDFTCDSDCSLREAIAVAGDGDLIRFASAPFGSSQTIVLGSQLNLTKSVTIEGTGADKLSISGNFASRVFASQDTSKAVTLKGMTIRDGVGDVGAGILSSGQLTLIGVAVAGNWANGSGLGGGVYQTGNGNFVGCTFSDNRGAWGGGIFFAQPAQSLRLANSTVSGNAVGDNGDGGGIAVYSSISTDVDLDVVNSTIVNNRGLNRSGGINLTSGSGGSNATVTLRNTIVADNVGPNFGFTHPPGTGTLSVESLGYNLTNDAADAAPYAGTDGDLFGVDPKLGPLNNNGGHVESHAVLGGSPALDAGHSSGYEKDVRGSARAVNTLGGAHPGDNADIGATEMYGFVVDTAADAGTYSLRGLMTLANGSSPQLVDILFDPAVFGTTPQTINLAGPLPNIGTNLSIHGPGAKLLTVRRDTGGDYSIFNAVNENAYELAFGGLTISNGKADLGGGVHSSSGRVSVAEVAFTGNSANVGGGLDVAFADATVKDSAFNGNSATTIGGGIFFLGNEHTMRVIATTISGNSAALGGGGIENATEGGAHSRVDIANSTIAANAAPSGGGVEAYSQTSAGSAAEVTLRNSIVANNTPANLAAVPNCAGCIAAIASRGFNLTDDPDGTYLDQGTDKVDTDPLLGPLAFNGGPTQTRALLAGSPAIDAGSSSGSNRDQRGLYRRIDFASYTNASDAADIGAFEYQDVIFADSFED